MIDRKTFQTLPPTGQLQQLRGLQTSRVFSVERSTVDEEKRTVLLSIASERPYERWWGVETLDMSRASIRDERLRAGAPLLVGHNPDDVVGVVESYEITAGRKLRVRARFGRSARAEEVWRDVLDGIRRNTSVGYIIHDLVLERQEENVSHYRVTDWEPFEGSLVSVPADPSVGVGRSRKILSLPKKGENAMKLQNPNHNDDLEEGDEESAVEYASRSARRRANKESYSEAQRIRDLLAYGDQWKDDGGPELARELINDPNATIDTFRTRLMDRLSGSQKVFSTAQPFEFPPWLQEPRAQAPRAGSARALKAFGDDQRVASQNAYASGQWLIAQLRGDDRAARWCREHGLEVRAASGGINSAGGYLVPDVLSDAVINLVEEFGVARKSCRVIPMSSDLVHVPRREGGVSAYYVSENSAITESQTTWGQVALSPKKLAVLSRMSSEIVEDAVIDLAAWTAQEAAQAFAEAEDDAWLNGDGTSAYGGMTGVRTKIIDGTHATGAVNATSGNNLLGEISTADLDKLVAALPAYALRNAKFYTSAAGYALIFQRLIEAAGGLTLADMVAGSIKKGYMGFPIEISQKMPGGSATDYTGKAMILFGDMAQSTMLGSRRDVRVMVDSSRYLEYDQTAVQVTERFDINVHDLGDNTTAGPVVALIGN